MDDHEIERRLRLADRRADTAALTTLTLEASVARGASWRLAQAVWSRRPDVLRCGGSGRCERAREAPCASAFGHWSWALDAPARWQDMWACDVEGAGLTGPWSEQYRYRDVCSRATTFVEWREGGRAIRIINGCSTHE